jgi:hypothetical protein
MLEEHILNFGILRFALLISAFRTNNFNSLCSSPLPVRIKQNYEKINIPFITFRDFNSDPKDDIIMKEYNNMVLQENSIFSKYKNHIIYILLDASHNIWLNDNYKNTRTSRRDV